MAVQKCHQHAQLQAIGYCTRCGCFGCSRCLLKCIDGNLYCLGCIRTLKMQVTQPAEDVRTQKSMHLKLVVHFKDGRILKGTSYKLDPHAESFYIVPLAQVGAAERVLVAFSDVKLVCHVREFSPPPDRRPSAAERSAVASAGHGRLELTVYFRDGEVLHGHPGGTYHPGLARFWLVPSDAGNNICVLVESSATKLIETGKKVAAQGLNDLISSPVRKTLLTLYRANSGLIESPPSLARRVGVRLIELEEALEPFYHLRLARKIKTATGEQIEFLPPLNRVTKDFVRSHVPKEPSLKITRT
ncbi:MAG: hypothetical protein V2A58_04485 [Planctomycetota bacterium]